MQQQWQTGDGDDNDAAVCIHEPPPPQFLTDKTHNTTHTHPCRGRLSIAPTRAPSLRRRSRRRSCSAPSSCSACGGGARGTRPRSRCSSTPRSSSRSSRRWSTRASRRGTRSRRGVSARPTRTHTQHNTHNTHTQMLMPELNTGGRAAGGMREQPTSCNPHIICTEHHHLLPQPHPPANTQHTKHPRGAQPSTRSCRSRSSTSRRAVSFTSPSRVCVFLRWQGREGPALRGTLEQQRRASFLPVFNSGPPLCSTKPCTHHAGNVASLTPATLREASTATDCAWMVRCAARGGAALAAFALLALHPLHSPLPKPRRPAARCAPALFLCDNTPHTHTHTHNATASHTHTHTHARTHTPPRRSSSTRSRSRRPSPPRRRSCRSRTSEPFHLPPLPPPPPRIPPLRMLLRPLRSKPTPA